MPGAGGGARLWLFFFFFLEKTGTEVTSAQLGLRPCGAGPPSTVPLAILGNKAAPRAQGSPSGLEAPQRLVAPGAVWAPLPVLEGDWGAGDGVSWRWVPPAGPLLAVSGLE